ncbi:MAG: hypothetical protein ACRD12_24600 [Acidimicrobiales bacterium]
MRARKRWVTTGMALATAATLMTGGLLLCAAPAGAVTSMTETPASSVTRPVPTLGQALIILATMTVTLAIWVVLLLVTKPLILRWLHVRRFRSQLRDLDGVSRAWRAKYAGELP